MRLSGTRVALEMFLSPDELPGSFDWQAAITRFTTDLTLPNLRSAESAAAKVRGEALLRKPEELVKILTRRDRMQAAAIAAYALPAIVPVWGTAAAAVAAAEALRRLLLSSVQVTAKIGFLLGHDLNVEPDGQAGILLVLLRRAVALDETGRAEPGAVLGDLAWLLEGPSAYSRLLGLSHDDRAAVVASQPAILEAWAWTHGPWLAAGLLPAGVGVFAAAQYIDRAVFKPTVAEAVAVFSSPQVSEACALDDLPDEDLPQ